MWLASFSCWTVLLQLLLACYYLCLACHVEAGSPESLVQESKHPGAAFLPVSTAGEFSSLTVVLGLHRVENSHGLSRSLIALALSSPYPGPPYTGKHPKAQRGGPTATNLVRCLLMCKGLAGISQKVSFFSFNSLTDFRCAFRNVC